MSNILIIKHGSLGDLIQANGAIEDIKNSFKNSKVLLLTSYNYAYLMSHCPYVDGVLIDKRLPRWNILYLQKLKKMLDKYDFSYVYDLQNSSRTSFYRKYLFKIRNWNCTETILRKNEKKKDFDKASVLERFKVQLEGSNIKTKYSLNPDFSWAKVNVDKIVNKYFGKKFILIFPFCSPLLLHKKWPYFNDLIKIIKSKHPNFEIASAPGPTEINESKNFNSVSITNNDKALNIMELAGLISKASYVIANDTGPAHMAAHLGQKGKVLFGYHTTPQKVSIETEKFKAIKTEDLTKLTAESVYLEIKDQLELINSK